MLQRLSSTFSRNLNLLTFYTRQANLSTFYHKQGLFPIIFSRNFSEEVKLNGAETKPSQNAPNSPDSKWMTKGTKPSRKTKTQTQNFSEPFNFDSNEEELTDEQQLQKQEIIRELTKKLSGPLADENGNVPTGDQRPIAIEVDGPSHFYSNSTKYTAYTKLKHRLLTRMGYKVLHVPFFEWRRLRGAREREEYMRAKLKEEPTEWLEPEDEEFYNKRMESLNREQTEAVESLNITNN